MEITHPDATKGQTLEILCKSLQIPMEAVMALGDSGNDITMLRQAGLGVAMGNAPDFVKQAADVCTDSYDADGAAKAIEQYAL
jgi:hydroxymethylpyrimidine pyrophosphatase-like HAD family hydrolase